MKKKRHVKLTLNSLLVLIIAGLFFTHFYAPRFITEINNPLIEFVRTQLLNRPLGTFKNLPNGSELLNFKSFDEIELSALITYAKIDSAKGTIVLLHGIRASKEHFIRLSRNLANQGFNTVALDLRAHGKSQGIHCSFGVNEKKDIVALINTILENNTIENTPIGIWGQSLGGAVALQAMAIDDRIQFGIIESTFSDFKTVTNDYFKNYMGFGFQPLTNYLVNRAGKIAGFNPDEASPIEYCKQIEQPVLMVHGTKDKRIKIDYGKANFKNLKSTGKRFLEIEGANHASIWETGGDLYFEKVFAFIEDNRQE